MDENEKPLICQHWTAQPDPAVDPDWQHLAFQVVADDGVIVCRMSDGVPVNAARLAALAPVMRDLLREIARSNSAFSNIAYTILCSIPEPRIDPAGYLYDDDGLVTDLFWSCQCEENNVHPYILLYCPKCQEWQIWGNSAPVDIVLNNRATLPARLITLLEQKIAAQQASG